MASDLPNINDIASVKSLLDQLSASQAWQEVTSSAQPNVPTVETVSSRYPADAASDIPTGTSVAALLSQLQESPAVLPQLTAPSVDANVDTYTALNADVYAPRDLEHTLQEDKRNYSFQKALPYIASLADDAVVLAEIRQLKIDQDQLEKRLWDERQAIFKKYEEKVSVAKNKAKVIGTGISKHEADMIKDNLKKELARFDQERALPSWDGLMAKQQTALENLGIPTMYATQDKTVRERQQRIIQVLEGVVGGEGG